MKFFIKSDAYKRVGAVTEYGTLPLRADERNFFLKADAEQILDNADRWTDFDELTGNFDEAKLKDYEEALTLLSAFGVAEIEEKPTKSEGIFVAGEREYAAVSEFLLKNRADANNFLWDYNADDEYFSLSKVRERQFNNIEYHFMYKNDDEILSVLIVRTAPQGTLSTSLLLSGLLFKPNLTAEEKQNIFGEFLRYVSKEFCGDYRRLRFLRKILANGCYEEIFSLLKEYNFIKKATLKNELLGGGDVEIYDFELRS